MAVGTTEEELTSYLLPCCALGAIPVDSMQAGALPARLLCRFSHQHPPGAIVALASVQRKPKFQLVSLA